MKAGWEETSIGKIAKVDWGNTSLTKKAFLEDGPYLGVSAAGCDGRMMHAEHQAFTPVLSAIGAQCGRMFLPTEDFTAIKNTITLTPISEAVDSVFLFYLLEFVKLPQRGAGQPFISKGDIQKFRVKVPPLEEQRRIVAVLDEAFEGLNRARENTEANLASAGELFKSWLARSFEAVLSTSDVKTLSAISDNLDRQRVPITKANRSSGDVPYYGASGVVDHVAECLFDESLLLVSEDGANLLARTYPIAFSISGPSWVNNHAHVLRFEDLNDQEYVRLYLNSISLEEYVTGMAQPKLNQTALNKIPIPFPERPLRSQICTESIELNRKVTKLEENNRQTLNGLDDLRQSLLQKAFAGELT